MSSFRKNKEKTGCGCNAPPFFSLQAVPIPVAPNAVNPKLREAQLKVSDAIDAKYLQNLSVINASPVSGHADVMQATCPSNKLGEALKACENHNLTFRASYMAGGAGHNPVCVELSPASIKQAMEGQITRVSVPIGTGHFDFSMNNGSVHKLQYTALED